MATESVETYENGQLVDTRDVEVPDEYVNQRATRQRAEDAIEDLRTIKNSSGTLTAAQLSNAVRVLATALLALLRLHLNRHEDTG